MRTAVTDISLGEAQIRAGDRVVVWIPSINRDETVFADAERFVVDRGSNPHLSFGGGPHYCVGAALARLEAKHAFGALVTRTRAIELATDRVTWRPALALRSLTELRVTTS